LNGFILFKTRVCNGLGKNSVKISFFFNMFFLLVRDFFYYFFRLVTNPFQNLLYKYYTNILFFQYEI
jgi:hypothetical protein